MPVCQLRTWIFRIVIDWCNIGRQSCICHCAWDGSRLLVVIFKTLMPNRSRWSLWWLGCWIPLALFSQSPEQVHDSRKKPWREGKKSSQLQTKLTGKVLCGMTLKVCTVLRCEFGVLWKVPRTSYAFIASHFDKWLVYMIGYLDWKRVKKGAK